MMSSNVELSLELCADKIKIKFKQFLNSSFIEIQIKIKLKINEN